MLAALLEGLAWVGAGVLLLIVIFLAARLVFIAWFVTKMELGDPDSYPEYFIERKREKQ